MQIKKKLLSLGLGLCGMLMPASHALAMQGEDRLKADFDGDGCKELLVSTWNAAKTA